jgi:hypothetical protein
MDGNKKRASMKKKKKLIWSKKKPTKPGWYWTRSKKFRAKELPFEHDMGIGFIVQVEEKKKGVLSVGINWPLPDGNDWAGPIPMPKEKK